MVLQLSARLSEGAGRLRAWEAQQAQLEGTLRMVRDATTEYNLLLLLLLRQHRRLPRAPPACKDPASDDHFLKHSATEASLSRAL